MNPNFKTINVQQALGDPNSVFYYYQKLIKLRHTLPVITDGTYALIPGNSDDEEIYAFTRTNADTTLVVILNYTNKNLTRHYDLPSHAKILISNYADDQGDNIGHMKQKFINTKRKV